MSFLDKYFLFLNNSPFWRIKSFASGRTIVYYVISKYLLCQFFSILWWVFYYSQNYSVLFICSAPTFTHQLTLSARKSTWILRWYKRFSSYRAVNTLRLGYTTIQSMLCMGKITAFCDIYSNPNRALCGENEEFLSVEVRST